MAVNKSNDGYSDALGGYGVPAQVELTAGSSAAASASSRRSAPRGNKQLIIIIAAVAVVAAVVVFLYVSGAFGSSQYAENISSIEKAQQNVNGAQVTNYLPLLAEDVDWAAIDEKKREGIAKYAVNEALAQAEADQASIFNIMGMTYDQSKPVFLYAEVGETKKIQIMVDSNLAGEVKLN
ncbi:MAG: hypothetical protein LBT52_00320 [Clostridiales Family XIII bacterium]|jgi:hypothetical protein|nr:hypothetical protein [Clostridiales Family XIII bacterium]